ncbi:MAG: thiamine diphosphokinase [Paracoccus sp. (in: a-proteobacteria)]|uniref:thiamine diphosphokinase n=1 Tax=Paracoccus sp. TaxID=267 RepID=UPI0026DF9350|nr:thiamine diphosphokinase [Paracoccus sp. (in: a-proteobacteria)]MDO5630425.1 thiamine diphosphokinase [Paracoccus sp. (in: a-proteobacteria)]
MTPILRSDQGVTLIGGGTVDRTALASALALAPVVAAADSGADAALAAGLVPAAVIGDFDSISSAARAAIPAANQHPVAEQDSTDFAKCLMRIAAPFVIAVGFDGRRVDHTLAAMTVLARHPQPPCVILTAADAVTLAPPDLRLDLPPGTRVSLFPLGPVTGSSTGLRWPIDGLMLEPAGRVGASNQATGPVHIRSTGPLLVILPARHLPALLPNPAESPI